MNNEDVLNKTLSDIKKFIDSPVDVNYYTQNYSITGPAVSGFNSIEIKNTYGNALIRFIDVNFSVSANVTARASTVFAFSWTAYIIPSAKTINFYSSGLVNQKNQNIISCGSTHYFTADDANDTENLINSQSFSDKRGLYSPSFKSFVLKNNEFIRVEFYYYADITAVIRPIIVYGRVNYE